MICLSDQLYLCGSQTYQGLFTWKKVMIGEQLPEDLTIQRRFLSVPVINAEALQWQLPPWWSQSSFPSWAQRELRQLCRFDILRLHLSGNCHLYCSSSLWPLYTQPFAFLLLENT